MQDNKASPQQENMADELESPRVADRFLALSVICVVKRATVLSQKSRLSCWLMYYNLCIGGECKTRCSADLT